MIYTSNYARNWDHPNAVGISGTVPKWGKPKRRCISLAPSYALVTAYKKNNISKEEYTELYCRNVLDRLSPEAIYKELGDGAVMLCYEKPNDFCHRHLVARWLEVNIGIEVKELDKENKK